MHSKLNYQNITTLQKKATYYKVSYIVALLVALLNQATLQTRAVNSESNYEWIFSSRFSTESLPISGLIP